MSNEAEKTAETLAKPETDADVSVVEAAAPAVEAAAPPQAAEVVAPEPTPAPAAKPAKPARTAKAPAKPAAKAPAKAKAPRRKAPVAKVAAAPAAPAIPAKAAPAAKAPEPARDVKPATVRKPAKPAARKNTTARLRAPAVRAKSVRIPAVKPTPAKPTVAVKSAPVALKEKIMAKTTTDFLAPLQSAFGEFQTKAKAAYEKSTAAVGEANDFAKGNVEAVVQSGKILASGLQDMGTTFVAESRSAFETMTAEVKELAAVKSPSEFFALQSKLARKNFDAAVAQASKNTEAMLKLVNEVVTPISGRVTLAVEKASKAA